MLIKRPMLLVTICFVIFTYINIVLTGGIDRKEYFSDDSEIIISGIINDKFIKNAQNTLYIKAGKRKYIVVLKSENNSVYYYKIGQKVRITGVYKNFSKAENDGQFDSMNYYRIRGFEAQIKKAEVLEQSISYNKYKNGLHNIRNRIEKIYKNNLEEREAATLSALCLGDKTSLPDDVKEAYQNAGISHVLSLSGLHIATLGLMLFSAIRRTGIKTTRAAVLAGFIMFSYSVMTGMSTSTQRALIMYVVAVIAKCLNRSYDILSALTLSVLLIIMENPYYMFDSGFLLSFLAVFSIAFLYPVIKGLAVDFTEIAGRILNVEINSTDNLVANIFTGAISSICISVSVMLATLPVIMSCFYKTSRYGIVLNIIVVPLMTVVLLCGILGGASSICEIPVLSKIVEIGALKICEHILRLYYKLADYFQLIKGNTWILGIPKLTNILVYIILIMLTVTTYNLVGKRRIIEKHKRYKKKRMVNIISTSLLITSVYIICHNPLLDLKIITMSVGQGSCNIIYGQNIPVTIYDGGSSDIKNVGKYRIIPCLLANGISRVDYIFISHNDADHVNGIKELLSLRNTGIEVKNVVMSYMDEEIYDICKDRNIKVYIMSQGDVISGDNYDIRCISPNSKEIENLVENNVNDASLVIEYTYSKGGFKALFTGDITSEMERKIIPRLNEYNFVTIAHHGSKYSNSYEFLEKTNADIYTISAGKDNSYGHPNKETLERLKELSLNYYRTDECGQITTTINDGKITVNKFLY